MKILMTARWPVGGIRTFLRYVYCEDVFNDCDVKFLAPGKGLEEGFAGFLPAYRFRVQVVDGGSRELTLAVRRRLRRERFDLIHSHGLTSGMMGQVASAGLDTPHLLTVHDVFLESTFSGMRGSFKKVAINRLLRGIEGVHAVGDDCGRNFSDHIRSVPRTRIHSIRNGVDTQRFFDATPIDVRKELQLSPGTALVGFFGRFMAQKGFRTLVDAVAQLLERGWNRPLVVLTFGWGGFIREDFAYVSEKGLDAVFLQQPHTDEPERWIKGLDLVAIPSRWEACPLLPMEVLAAGVPLIGTSCLGLREVLAGSPALTLEPGDVNGLSDALRSELEFPRHEEFERYSKTAVKKFNVRESAVRLRALYSDLVGTKR